MESRITPAKIAEWKQFLKDHPIDPAWDDAADTFDAYIPEEQADARMIRFLLKKLGELD